MISLPGCVCHNTPERWLKPRLNQQFACTNVVGGAAFEKFTTPVDVAVSIWVAIAAPLSWGCGVAAVPVPAVVAPQ
jgi:hypothetical protein